ncbi:outer membrane protein assembly factor BamD [Marinirhabdus gelatinilytica]|uniref:Beta-barrel assembly machine subunit BamD n=1 Tax=Marinirhabdus gelatinilytica TaxID=1703343 RepID=A0A370QET0_9FLAO|nr:outer membrane protein assembly factor BamD [Marinirhabdus gelatinilytica]RDK86861.1 Beta-barrel assembly machine subunit BamD [Marinirhabdus gelatinilytica]
MFLKYLTTLFLSLLAAVMLSSCSNYQKILASDDTAAKYNAADSLYKIGKYRKALKLMEQIVPAYRGKPQAERLMFIYANTFYNLEDFYLAGYQFERFVTSYPKSDSAEVAAYKGATSYYQLSPRFSLDQKDTRIAMEKLQEYINTYPNSPYRAEANGLVKELREKLEKKDFETAMQYLDIAEYLGSYVPAIEAFENFILDHPGSKYRKEAFYGRLEAGYQRAITGVPTEMQQRLVTAKGYYNAFNKYYKNDTSEYKQKADDIAQEIEARTTIETEEETIK